MKKLTLLALIALCSCFVATSASAQIGPGPQPAQQCSCDFCYYNPYATCSVGISTGPCYLYGYLQCPFFEPGTGLTESNGGETLGTLQWRDMSITDVIAPLDTDDDHDHSEPTAHGTPTPEAQAQPMTEVVVG